MFFHKNYTEQEIICYFSKETRKFLLEEIDEISCKLIKQINKNKSIIEKIDKKFA
jgi:hypothetical protein